MANNTRICPTCDDSINDDKDHIIEKQIVSKIASDVSHDSHFIDEIERTFDFKRNRNANWNQQIIKHEENICKNGKVQRYLNFEANTKRRIMTNASDLDSTEQQVQKHMLIIKQHWRDNRQRYENYQDFQKAMDDFLFI